MSGFGRARETTSGQKNPYATGTLQVATSEIHPFVHEVLSLLLNIAAQTQIPLAESWVKKHEITSFLSYTIALNIALSQV